MVRCRGGVTYHVIIVYALFTIATLMLSAQQLSAQAVKHVVPLFLPLLLVYPPIELWFIVIS